MSPASSGRTTPRPPSLVTSSGRRSNIVSFTLTALAGVAQAWALICAARSLGSILPTGPAGSDPLLHGNAGSLLITAAISAALCALFLGVADLVARKGACREEPLLRARALSHLFTLGPGRTARQRTGSTVSLLTDGAERVAVYRQTFLAPTLAAGLSPALALAVLALSVDPLSAVVLLLAVIAIPMMIGLAHKNLRAPSSDSRRARMRLAAEYLDAIQGLPTLTLARAARRTHTTLRRRGEENRKAVMGLLAGNQLVILITDVLFSLFFITVAFALAAWRLKGGQITSGDALAIVLVSYVLLEPLDHVGAFFYVGMGGLANQRAFRELLSVKTPKEAVPALSSSTEPKEAPSARIAVRNVSATWDEERGTVLSGVDFSVAPGEHLAVVGPSGSGKSTLMSLLSGDLFPSVGTLSIAGTPLDGEHQEQFRSHSALVAQSTWLFTGSIADNLRLGAPEASEDDMWKALEAVSLADEVRNMPQALDTQLGEQGLGLSGGQAQRLSLARAILADRPVLLLDEPTSQVDLASEAQILAAIPAAAAGRAVVTVSHRAGALVAADRVVEVRDGFLTEQAQEVRA